MKEGEYRPQPSQPDNTQPLQGRAEGRESLQGPTTVDRSKQPKSQPGSTLSRAVERTRELYERNGWVFLPLGEPVDLNLSSANRVDTEPTEAVLKDNPPIKKRRWHVGAAGGDLHGYGDDESPKKGVPT